MNFFAKTLCILWLLYHGQAFAQATQFVITTQPQDGAAGVSLANIVGEFRTAGDTLFSTTAAATLALSTSYSETRSGAQLTFVSTDSFEPAFEGTKAFDSDTTTIWHTHFSGGSVPGVPHHIIFDIGTNSKVINLLYTPRQTNPNGRIANYEVYLSADGVTWGAAVATGTWANSATQQSAVIAGIFGRYVQLRELTEVLGQAFGSAAEIAIQRTTTGLGTLTGTLTRNAVGGIVTFNDIALTAGGTYVLQVTSPGIIGAQSTLFTVTSSPPGTPENIRATPEPY